MESSDLESRRLPDAQATLACERCRKRKIKCDRVLPACRTCFNTSRQCSYPSIARKPGPKPGAPQRRRPRINSALPRQNVVPSETALPVDGIQSALHEDQDVTISSTPANRLNPPRERSPVRGLALSQLVHPSHEPVQNSVIEPLSENENAGLRNDHLIDEVCKFLHISGETYRYLLQSYLENMTAFSLFHRPSFERKLLAITSPLQLQALVAAICSFSAQFHDTPSGNLATLNLPSQLHFRTIAVQAVEDALKQCSDGTPPLCLLQALIIITFDELIRGARGRAWRSVGLCVRLAYELQLHLVDKDSPNTTALNYPIDPLAEEKRRAWWAIWEFDVFASTIRRLPTAIDWALNATWLPVDDEVWFADGYAKSCYLDPDPSSAWKSLQKSCNQSPKAWFIAVNALIRCAHLLSYPQAYQNAVQGQRLGVAENVQGHLDVLSNALYCLSAVLPPRLSYQGEYLPFSKDLGESLHLDSAKYSIHVMTQTSRFMINHYQVFDSTSRQPGLINGSSNQSTPAVNQSAWNHYLAAASEIVTLVRSCSPRHVNYVNPFLASTVWLAAAAQIVSKHRGPHLIDRRVPESNFDLLQTNLNAFVSTWGTPSALQQTLATLGARLENFAERTINPGLRQSRTAEQTLYSVDAGTGGLGEDQTTQNGDNVNISNQPPQLTGPSTNDWSFQQGLDMTGPEFGLEFGPALGLDLWGWGIDELLTYNGMNELPTY
ncbi:hypothetical protein N431DRAFT_141380 [Stipitochalara longipes BDJ]|nr:hypothetical protein N431DRAFT_141380 [Stipitochalara longipes BDJ]